MCSSAESWKTSSVRPIARASVRIVSQFDRDSPSGGITGRTRWA
jgi:hypothetical protein